MSEIESTIIAATWFAASGVYIVYAAKSWNAHKTSLKEQEKKYSERISESGELEERVQK